MRSSYGFKFKDNDTGKKFECNVAAMRCKGHVKNGAGCKRTVVIGTPYCFQHLEKIKHLKIKKAGNLGKGVFAWDKTKRDGACIYKKGDEITKYEGEVLTERQLDARYGPDRTAPYGLQIGNKFVDLACKRGLGGIFNHKDRGNAASLVEKKVGRGRPYLAVEADKCIRNKQQIFVNYAPTPEGHRGERVPYLFNENTRHSTKKISKRR